MNYLNLISNNHEKSVHNGASTVTPSRCCADVRRTVKTRRPMFLEGAVMSGRVGLSSARCIWIVQGKRNIFNEKCILSELQS